jgi:hypothetical protein
MEGALPYALTDYARQPEQYECREEPREELREDGREQLREIA